MYTKVIKCEQFLPKFDVWVEKMFKTTDDAIWLHLEAMNLDKNIRKIVVSDIV